jgi:ParB-like chromosome segregation protein Spo0J|tara:strand:- start:394 stop:1005 length:612 start_codon:yes stop_codon:yes gene_type:complete
MRTITKIKIEDIKPYAENPRNMELSLPKVKESISNFGFNQPVLLDRNYIIITGHTRYAAAKELGLTELPCIIVDELNPNQIRAYRIADNKVGQDGTWDVSLLKEELKKLRVENFPVTHTGYSDAELENLEIELDKIKVTTTPELSSIEAPNFSDAMVNLNFTMKPQERLVVMNYLNYHKQTNKLNTTAEALVHLAREDDERND